MVDAENGSDNHLNDLIGVHKSFAQTSHANFSRRKSRFVSEIPRMPTTFANFFLFCAPMKSFIRGASRWGGTRHVCVCVHRSQTDAPEEPTQLQRFSSPSMRPTRAELIKFHRRSLFFPDCEKNSMETNFRANPLRPVIKPQLLSPCWSVGRRPPLQW